MEVDSSRLAKSKSSELVGALVLSLVSAAIGGLVGWFFVAIFVQAAGQALNVAFLTEHARVIGAVGVAFLLGMRSFTKSLQESKRRESRRSLAAETGFEFDTDLKGEYEEAIQEMLGNRGFFFVSNVLKKDFDETHVIIADVKIKHSSQSSDSDHYTQQTIAFIESDEFSLPTFTLQPTRMLSNLLAKMAGVKDINFETHQEFSDKYLLSGHFEGRIRTFFDDPLLDFFSNEKGWQVEAKSNRLMIYKPNYHPTGEAAKQFMDDALVIFGAIRNRALEMPTPTEEESSQPMSAREAAEQIGGLAGRMIRSQLVTRGDVQQLIGEPAPRNRIPDAIRRTKLGLPFLAIFGLAFTAFGSLFATIALLSEENAKKGDQWMFVLMGSIFVMIGLPILIGSVTSRFRTAGLLRRGKVATGEILEVHRTGTTVNNERRYLIEIRYVGNGESITRKFAAYGAAVEHARQLKESGDTVHVLYSDQKPQRAMWAEGLITALPEYD